MKAMTPLARCEPAGIAVLQYTPEPLVLKMLALVGFALVAWVAMYHLYL